MSVKITAKMVQAGLPELLHTADEDVITYAVAEDYLRKALEASPYPRLVDFVLKVVTDEEISAEQPLKVLEEGELLLRELGKWPPQ